VFGKKRKHARKKEVERPLASSLGGGGESHPTTKSMERVLAGSNERERKRMKEDWRREKGESWKEKARAKA